MIARRVFIKICGLTEPDQAVAVAEAGADAVGFIFWAGSSRVITVDRAREIWPDLQVPAYSSTRG